MRRIMIMLSAAVMLLAFGPATALARHDHHRREARHHSRDARHHRRHARIEHFGDINSTPTASSSTDRVGTVQSFDNGRLTILLNDGSTVSGRVTRDTELKCIAPEPSSTMHDDGDRAGEDPSGDGDNSGSGDERGDSSGEQSSGEDQGDAAEQNEDQAEEQNENEAAEEQNENEAAEENENEMENNCSASNLSHGA